MQILVSNLAVLVPIILGSVTLIVAAYLIVRAGSLGYFRTRNEYERARENRKKED